MPTFSKHGLELSVNTAGASMQDFSRLATFADGGFVVVWATLDTAADGSGGAIKAQRFDSAGNKLGGEFLVNSSFASGQTWPAVTSFADGSFAVAWTTDDPLQDGNGRAIKARLFSASGAAAGPEFLVNTTTAGNQIAPSMATLANGNFLISWGDGFTGEVQARLFTATGTALGPDFRLNTNMEGSQNSTAVSALAGGGFVAIWRSTNTADDGSGESVKAQVFDSAGARVGGEFLVNTNKFGHQNDPAVAALAGGGFIVTWVTSQAEDGNGSAIKAQVFSASGAKVGTEFLVNSAGFSGQEQPVVTALPDGGFMIAWTTIDTAQDGSGYALKAQLFNSAGARIGTEFLVNTQANGNQSVADIATLSDGRVIVTWTDTYADGPANWGIKAQILGAGDPPPPPPPPNWAPVITSNGGGASAILTVAENVSLATHVTAQDPDGQAVTYAIVGGTDAARFTISAQSGILSFVSGPDFEAPGDADGNNSYQIIVSASDGSLADTQILTIWIADVDENVAFTSSNNIFRPENYNAPYMVTAVQPQDPAAAITYRIVGGADAARFALDGATGALSLTGSPDYEAPADAGGDNSYNVMIEATDGVTTATQSIMFHIYDVNESPVITSGNGGATFAVSISENGTQVTSVSASDPESTALVYAIVGGADAARLNIDAVTGALSFVAAPDFEAPEDSDGNNIYVVTVSASDGTRTDTQILFVTVTNQNESPAITSNGGGSTAAIAVVENGVEVTTVRATDPENATIAYAIAGGADASRFLIDSATGALSFLMSPDHEQPADSDGDNVYEVAVRASDGVSSDTQALSVTVGNANERPVIVSNGGGTSAFVELDEGRTAVTTVAAADPDGVGVMTYSITGGAHADLFVIDSATGALSFAAAPDYEAPLGESSNFYSVTVTASDGELSSFQSVQVGVRNVNEGVVITSAANMTAYENFAEAGTVAATDLDGDAVSFAIAGGADGALFEIDAVTGALSFLAAPDHEAPADADGDNVYEVAVSASDGNLSDVRTLFVTVANVYEGISFGGSSVTLGVDENVIQAGVVAAVSGDGAELTYTITGGEDSPLFSIDPTTGAISFRAAPDYESPQGSNGSNDYRLTVTASDGTHSSSQFVTVVVGNVDEGIELLSYEGDESVALSVAENGGSVGQVEARDLDGDPVTYSIAGGADAAQFAVDAATGALSFLEGADFENPSDSGGDNIYDVVVAASSGGSTATQAFAVSVANRNDGIFITSNGGGNGAGLTFEEGTSLVTTVAAYDPDGTAPVYSIIGGNDASHFTIDPVTGVLRFVGAPDYETPLDAHGDNIYEVIVSASDGELSSSQFLSVLIRNVNEAVTITSGGGADSVAVTIDEDQAVVASVSAVDADGTPVFYSIAGGADAPFFEIDPLSGDLRIASVDYEAYGDSDGDNVYEVIVAADDGWLSDTQAYWVTLANVDEALFFTSYASDFYVSLAVGENSLEAAVVAAEDPEGAAIVYSVVDGYDGASFTIDAQTGVLQFLTAPNHESPADLDGDNVYTVLVAATDGRFFDYQTISIRIEDLNEGVTIFSPSALSVEENQAAVSTVVANDADGDSVIYAIAGGADSAFFTIDAQTGALAFAQAPNFEAPGDSDGDNVYEVTVSASDGTLSDSRSLSISVLNRNEGIFITSNGGGTSATLSRSEGNRDVTTVVAGDPDGTIPTYSILGGPDSSLFVIDALTGVLTFIAAPDYEAPSGVFGINFYTVEVGASDGEYTSRQTIQIGIDNVNESVTITSGGGAASFSVTVAENGTAVTTIAASDADGDALTYSITGGADSARFAIDAVTGALRFVQAPNFEAPADVGGNNVYDVVVSVTDGAFTDSQAVAVTVANVNEAVVISSNGGGASASVSVAENISSVTIVAAADPDGPAATYSIVGGADAARFTINAQTGALQFVAAPDWELPADSNQDNVYAVVVRASDGQFADDQALNVSVTNTRDGNNVTGTSGGDTISATSTNVALRTSNEEDVVYGRDGHDTIQGMAGDDDLYGEAGNDVLTGGAGADRLTGGLGKDEFTYSFVSESTVSSRDQILDFSRAQGDKIALSAIDANANVSNNQAFTFIGTAAFSNVAGQLRYETSGGVTTISGDVNGDGVADLQILVSGSLALVASDFVL